MLLAQQIELRPEPAQADYLNRALGARRHCYNQLLAHFSQPDVKWSKAAAYQHYMTVLRFAFPWYSEVSSRVTRNAIDDLDRAFKNFFRRAKQGIKPPGYPQFKRKGERDAFALREENKFDVSGRQLRIEKLKTPIALRQDLRFTGQTKLRLARLHQRISHQRQAVLHELSDQLTRTYRVITIEDLNVKGMLRNHSLARVVTDAGFGELRRQIEYKAALRGVSVVIADRFFPSSKMCHACGQIHDMPLEKRTLVCDCGHVMDRDLNAAKNLDRYGLDRLDALKPDVKRTQEPHKTASAASVLTA